MQFGACCKIKTADKGKENNYILTIGEKNISSGHKKIEDNNGI